MDKSIHNNHLHPPAAFLQLAQTEVVTFRVHNLFLTDTVNKQKHIVKPGASSQTDI